MTRLLMMAFLVVISWMLCGVGTAQGQVPPALGKADGDVCQVRRDPFVPPYAGEASGVVKGIDKAETKKTQHPVTHKDKAKDKKALALQKPPQSHFVVTGVVTGAGGNRAIIYHREQKASALVSVGMKVGNYLVTGIFPTHVEMKRDSQSLRLMIGSRD